MMAGRRYSRKNERKMKLTVKFFLLLCMILFVSTKAKGNFLSAATQENQNSEQLALALENAKKEIVDKEIHQRKVMSSLYEINRKMKKIISDESNLSQQKMVFESSAKDLAIKILDLEEKLKVQKSLMRERLSAIYKLGGQGLARLIFSSSSSAELEKNLKILGIIAKRDLDVIKEHSATMKELENKKIKFIQRLTKIKILSNEIKTHEARLNSENNSKSKILDNIRKSKQFSLNRLSGLRSKSNELVAQDESGVLDLLFHASFYEKKKSLPTPVRGPIVKNFGVIRDEEHNLTWSHKGLLFSVPLNSPVKTVFDGTVAFVGDLPGHNQTVIIDHGDHYYSVYGNNNKVLVSVGDEILQNQVIAHSGRNDDGENEASVNGLYFEIRHFSEPYDPKLWLKGTL